MLAIIGDGGRDRQQGLGAPTLLRLKGSCAFPESRQRMNK
ncbi:conserved hypothetical protein [Stutzerimonas stutzeri A1501]|uniref:Uncharacterized protein n=1 Tax=Stutzerimonas stutzeri (strain A1501) TaxID=379731 RepID=A4VJD9_STUS1|nr:conserved hypothetical protein [Stutzerimonas stutzeri A1501]